MFSPCTSGPPRNEALLEAVVKQARTTRHPWLIACDAHMCPEDSEKSLWFQRELMHVAVPKEASTCRSKSLKDVWIERTYDHVVASGSLKGKISQMDVVEDFESRPHEAVSFVGEKRGGGEGVERAEDAEGAAWLQWRKVARKEYRRDRDQESNRSRSGRMHQGEDKCA